MLGADDGVETVENVDVEVTLSGFLVPLKARRVSARAGQVLDSSDRVPNSR